MPAAPCPPNDTSLFQEHESAVRSYCRRMPNVFTRGRNARVWDEAGTEYIDFFSACGALNYGHNHPAMADAAVAHLRSDAILCGLDLHTATKRQFIADFNRIVLRPRGLDYRLQFPGPTGTNAVEAALKLARKVTRRRTVVAFSRAFHGMSLGALAATQNPQARRGAGVPLPHVTRLAYDGDTASGLPSFAAYEAGVLSGLLDRPAAFLVETVQGEGGLHVASGEWLRTLAGLARSLGSLLIVDDVQAGCGRTGPFFSFERADLRPDIVCLAKSISGLGLPMALVLIAPEHDVWAAGEHNGTFRGNNLAFATASAALELWEDDAFVASKRDSETTVREWLVAAAEPRRGVAPCGLGLMAGLRFAEPGQARALADALFERRMLIETAGPQDEVLKLMPPLTIDRETLAEGLRRIGDAMAALLHQPSLACRRAAA